jgi:hypothetical protein
MVSRFCRPVWSLVVLLVLCSCATAQEDPLRRFLQNHVGSPESNEGKATRYFAAFVHLRDDNMQQAIVYLMNGGWCGSGGCTVLILEPKASTYTLITRVMTTRPPIRVLSTKTNGWHDLAVRVQGGGIANVYETKLPFNGKSYPTTPSMPPAQRLTTETAGEVIVAPAVVGEPLYP